MISVRTALTFFVTWVLILVGAGAIGQGLTNLDLILTLVLAAGIAAVAAYVRRAAPRGNA